MNCDLLESNFPFIPFDDSKCSMDYLFFIINLDGYYFIFAVDKNILQYRASHTSTLYRLGKDAAIKSQFLKYTYLV